MKKLIHKFFFICLNIIFIYCLLLQDINLKPNLLLSIILFLICLLYIFGLLQIYKAKPSTSLLRTFFKYISSIDIFKIYVSPYIEKIICTIFDYIYETRYHQEEKQFYKMYLYTYIYPRGFIILFFIIDIFVYQQIYFYYMLPLLLLPLIQKSLMFYLRFLLKEYLLVLGKFYIELIHSDNSNYFAPIDAMDDDYIPVKKFFDRKNRNLYIFCKKFFHLQYCTIMYNCEPYKYVPTIHEDYFNFENKSESEILQEYYNLENITCKLFCFFESYNEIFVENKHKEFIKNTKMGIITIEFLCCLYLFIASFSLDIIIPLLSIVDSIEPFSGLFL